jgi:3-deoxy-D-arabino-heptulosonate 7-phosphate (DAHP) synthase class II
MTACEAVASAVLARPAGQQPRWPDLRVAEAVRRHLAQQPPLVSLAEVTRLTAVLGEVAQRSAYVVTSGDCAETFDGNTPEHIVGNLRQLDELSAALAGPHQRPVARIGRLAGQYTKPRSADTDQAGLQSYRGDAVNALAATATARTPDPRRMLRAYGVAATTRNAVHPAGCGYVTYLGHEALLLDYECGLMRRADDVVYGASGHFLWVGDRTRQPGGAHLAFAAAVANPVGVKLGPSADPGFAAYYARLLNPCRTPGRLTFITRMGARAIWRKLPGLIAAVCRTGIPVVWQCDPMHGNTVCAGKGLKTRYLSDILAEVRAFFTIHGEMGSHPGGVHVEATGDDVTECIGAGVTAADLRQRYRSACDPRLNPAQVRELAALLRELRAPVPECPGPTAERPPGMAAAPKGVAR